MTRTLLLGLLALSMTNISAIEPATAGEITFFRDFATSEVPDPGSVELSADYLRMNDAIDLFDFRERETDAAASSPALGDLQGGKLMVNMGLYPKTGLHLSYSRIDLEAGPVKFPIDSFDLYLRRQLLSQKRGGLFQGSLDIGGRYDRAADRTMSRASDIDSFIKRIDPQLSIRETGTNVIISNGEFLIQAPKEGRPPLEVSLEDLQDYTVYARLTLGHLFDSGSIHFFSEVGRSEIDSRVDSTLDAFVPASLRGNAEVFPIDLDRHEYFWKGGSNLQYRLPFGVVGNLRYEYLRMDREDDLDYVDYNHVVKGDLIWPINEALALDLGATYLRRQFNGVVPFMYNRLTQSTFDHNYGFVHMGLIYRFF